MEQKPQETKKLPEYFVIQQQKDNPLWAKYIEWLNGHYDSFHDGTANYYGFCDHKGKKTTCFWAGDTHDPIPLECYIITLEEWDSIVNQKEAVKIRNYSYTSEYFEPVTSKQPKLKVGDSIPAYLDGKLQYNHGSKKDWVKGFDLYLDTVAYKLLKVMEIHQDIDEYFVTNGFRFKISEVDALIEEHENRNQKEWIPQNGEEIEVFIYSNKDWSKKYFIGFSTKSIDEYVCEDENGFVTKHDTVRKPIEIVRKTHSEIAEMLGISKEQLKIVEG